MNMPTPEKIVSVLVGILEARYGLDLTAEVKDSEGEKPFIFTSNIVFTQVQEGKK